MIKFDLASAWLQDRRDLIASDEWAVASRAGRRCRRDLAQTVGHKDGRVLFGLALDLTNQLLGWVV